MRLTPANRSKSRSLLMMLRPCTGESGFSQRFGWFSRRGTAVFTIHWSPTGSVPQSAPFCLISSVSQWRSAKSVVHHARCCCGAWCFLTLRNCSPRAHVFAPRGLSISLFRLSCGSHAAAGNQGRSHPARVSCAHASRTSSDAPRTSPENPIPSLPAQVFRTLASCTSGENPVPIRPARFFSSHARCGSDFTSRTKPFAPRAGMPASRRSPAA